MVTVDENGDGDSSSNGGQTVCVLLRSERGKFFSSLSTHKQNSRIDCSLWPRRYANPSWRRKNS